MKCNWTTKKLSEIAYINPRESLGKGVVAKKVPMDKLQPFCRDIPEFVLEEYKGGTKFRNGDTIMARITPCLENGKIAKVSVLSDGEVGFGSTEYIVFRAIDGVSDANFLYYLICSPLVRNPAIKSMVGSSGRQRVQTDVVANLDVELPPIEEQRKIGGLLKAIDDKIELNNVINNNLEQQAKTLFKSWFVDFEPFDESFVDSPIGTKIPHSLQMVQIGSLSHILETGKRPKGGAVATGVPSIGAENVKRLGEVNFASAKYIPVEFAQKMDKGKVHGYELMLYKDGGKPGTFIPHFSMFGEGFPYDDFYINEHVFKLDFGDKDYMKKVYDPSYSYKNNAHCLWQFANEIKIGDVIFVKKGMHKIIGKGVVTSEYIYDSARETYKHIRKVEWTNKGC